LTGFESSGGRISGFILWGVKYSTLDSLGGYVEFFHKKYIYAAADYENQPMCHLLFFCKNLKWTEQRQPSKGIKQREGMDCCK